MDSEPMNEQTNPEMRPLRVLALDGGGIRGVIPATVLAEIERRTGQRTAEMFDLIAGTSTGGILALGLTTPDPSDATKPRYTAEELVGMYTEKGSVIFSQSLGHRLATLFGLFGSKYAVRGLDETLHSYFGASRLKDAVAEVLITSYDLEKRDSWFLARYKARADTTKNDFPMVHVARATSAAPTYFRPERLSVEPPTAMIDGGVHSNNPAMCAWVETVKLYGEQDVVLVSLGTGQVKTPISYAKARAWGLIGWVRPLIGIFMDGVAATVEHELSWLLTPKDGQPRYFRLQAELPPGMGSMDNASPEHIAALKNQAELIIASNGHNLDALCELLADDGSRPPPLEPVEIGVSPSPPESAVEAATPPAAAAPETVEPGLEWYGAELPMAEPPAMAEPSPNETNPELRLDPRDFGASDYESLAEMVAAALELPARYVNLAISDAQQQLLPKSEPLRPTQRYLVRIDVGPLTETSLVEGPPDINQALQQFEPDIDEGYWLDAVLSSADVDVQVTIGRFFLPVEGASWVCSCVGPQHTCSRSQRQPYLYLPFQTRRGHKRADLRCTIYHRNNALQSLRLRVQVTSGQTRTIAQVAEVDYALSPALADLDDFAERELNVLTNESVRGTHTIVVKDAERAVQVSLNETAAKQVLDAFRHELELITVGTNGDSPFGADNSKSTADFIHDLRQLAHLGSQFWGQVVPNILDALFLNAKLKTRSNIQIARVTSVVFPWALVYDLPHTINKPWTLCPLLTNWDAERSNLSDYPTECPHSSEHQPEDTLCPYGFWGFRHMIEQPPSLGPADASTRAAVKKIPVAADSRAALVRSLALDAQLSATHVAGLEQCLHGRFTLADCDSLEDLVAAIIDPKLPLIYFYCHGKVATLADTDLPIPYLEIGTDDKLGPNDLRSMALAGRWNVENWTTVPPLIFINGCHTTALSPEDIANWVTALTALNAAGVVGTEISVLQPVASEVALNFYGYFTAPTRASVGESLYKTRIDLLMKGNVAGLVYTPFCSMDLALDTDS